MTGAVRIIVVIVSVLLVVSTTAVAATADAAKTNDNGVDDDDGNQKHPHADETDRNMNRGGLPYVVANAPNYDTTRMARTAESFDVYSKPIRTLYSHVHWISHGAMKLPPSIIERFADGRVLALTGYEVDQVQTLDDDGTDVSVPITHSYNHHYLAYL